MNNILLQFYLILVLLLTASSAFSADASDVRGSEEDRDVSEDAKSSVSAESKPVVIDEAKSAVTDSNDASDDNAKSAVNAEQTSAIREEKSVNGEEKEYVFSSKIKLGLQNTYGNVEQTGYNYKFSLKLKTGSNTLSFKGSGKYGEEKGTPYQDKRKASLLDTYSFSSFSSAYLSISYNRDWFQGYKYKWNAGIGYLHTWHEDEKNYFKSRMGYQRRREEDINDNVNELDFMLLGWRAKYSVMENIFFKAELNYEREAAQSKNYEAEGMLAFVFLVNQRVNIEINYEVEFDNIPVEGKEKTDRSLSVYLVITF